MHVYHHDSPSQSGPVLQYCFVFLTDKPIFFIGNTKKFIQDAEE